MMDTKRNISRSFPILKILNSCLSLIYTSGYNKSTAILTSKKIIFQDGSKKTVFPFARKKTSLEGKGYDRKKNEKESPPRREQRGEKIRIATTEWLFIVTRNRSRERDRSRAKPSVVRSIGRSIVASEVRGCCRRVSGKRALRKYARHGRVY